MSADLSTTIEPRTDQLNADCLLAGPITIHITKVVKTGSKEQPVAISYEDDKGRPYKPNLSMRRVLFQVWSGDGSSYVGRRLTLFRNPDIKFGADTVGGIEISHMSDIDRPVTVHLTKSRGVRKPFTVQPLKVEPEKRRLAKSLDDRVAAFLALLQACATVEAVDELCDSERAVKLREEVSVQVRTDILLAREKRVAEIKGATE